METSKRLEGTEKNKFRLIPFRSNGNESRKKVTEGTFLKKGRSDGFFLKIMAETSLKQS